jgi:hypothetical protein
MRKKAHIDDDSIGRQDAGHVCGGMKGARAPDVPSFCHVFAISLAQSSVSIYLCCD